MPTKFLDNIFLVLFRFYRHENLPWDSQDEPKYSAWAVTALAAMSFSIALEIAVYDAFTISLVIYRFGDTSDTFLLAWTAPIWMAFCYRRYLEQNKGYKLVAAAEKGSPKVIRQRTILGWLQFASAFVLALIALWYAPE